MPSPELIPSINGPLNRLFFAINCYISTGDHIGEGFATDAGLGKFMILIPVNPKLPPDLKDFAAFRSRFQEIAGRFHTTLEYQGLSAGMEIYSFVLAENRVDEMAKVLRECPGPLGWGSQKPRVDAMLNAN